MGDITNQETLQKILSLSENKKIDLVLCDGAPDITGFNEFDIYVQSQLVSTALNISTRMLKEGGNFVTKFLSSLNSGLRTLRATNRLSLWSFDL